jgi:hypothetical protein
VQADDEDEDDELEGDAYGVPEAALQTLVTNAGPYGEGEEVADHREHAEPAREEAAHDRRSAQEQEGHAEQDPEVALEAPLDPANGFGIGIAVAFSAPDAATEASTACLGVTQSTAWGTAQDAPVAMIAPPDNSAR